MKIWFCIDYSSQLTHGYKCTIKCLWAVLVFVFYTQSVSLCYPLTHSLFLRTSPPGIGNRGRHRRCGHPPHRHCVLQAVQEEESEAAGRKRGGSPQREKRPHCVVRPRERQRERKRGIERGTEEPHTSSLTLRLTLGIGACAAPSWGLGLFSFWTFNFLLPLGSQTWTIVDGQLSLTRDKSRMCLCVGSCRFRALANFLGSFYDITMCLSFLERNNIFITSSFPVQLNGLPNTFPV